MKSVYTIYYIPQGKSTRNRFEHYWGIKPNLDNLQDIRESIQKTEGPVKMKTYEVIELFSVQQPEVNYANI